MGIGAAIARALAGEGAAVAVVDRDAAAARQVSAEITEAGGRAIAVAGSVTDAADAERAVQAAADAFGGLDLLVNNAGVVIYGVLPEVPGAGLGHGGGHQSQGPVPDGQVRPPAPARPRWRRDRQHGLGPGAGQPA